METFNLRPLEKKNNHRTFNEQTITRMIYQEWYRVLRSSSVDSFKFACFQSPQLKGLFVSGKKAPDRTLLVDIAYA